MVLDSNFLHMLMFVIDVQADRIPICACLSSMNRTETNLLFTGDLAEFKDLAAAALRKHQSEVNTTLNRQHTHLSKLAKSADGHRRHTKQELKQAVKLLRQRILKQERRTRQLKAQQAQHAQHIQGLTHCLGTVGVESCHKLMQLAEDVKKGNVQYKELSSQVRANTRAQNLLTRLAGVIDELRVQLQV